MYEILFTTAAKRFLKKIVEKPLKGAFEKAILEIMQNPYIGQPKRGDLTGIYGYDIHYRETNFEIAYRIIEDDHKKVIVVLAGTRENFYQELKRYLKSGETKLNL